MNEPIPTRALVLWQPWASLLFQITPATGLPWKQIETRSWPWPSTIELPCRVLVYAAKASIEPGLTVGPFRVAHHTCSPFLTDLIARPMVNEFLPRGVVLGDVVITESLPILPHSMGLADPDARYLNRERLPEHPSLWLRSPHPDGPPTVLMDDVSDQLPFGDFSTDSQRFAWMCENARKLDVPISEYPCPTCEGRRSLTHPYRECGTCEAVGTVDVRGYQRVFTPPSALVAEFDRRINV